MSCRSTVLVIFILRMAVLILAMDIRPGIVALRDLCQSLPAKGPVIIRLTTFGTTPSSKSAQASV